MEAGDQEILRKVADRFALDLGIPAEAIDEAVLQQLATMVDAAVEMTWEGTGRYVGGTPNQPGTMGLVIPPRQLMRQAKSIKWGNFGIDPAVGVYTALATAFGSTVLASGFAAATLPITLPGFALALGFAVYKAFEKHISYEEAALLHAMQARANFHRFVPTAEAMSLGEVLVSEYGYPKGNNSNEIETLLKKLISINALERTTGGYRLLESTRVWRGRPQ